MISDRTARWRACVTLLLAWWLAMPAAARAVPELDVSRQPVALQDWGDAWIDRSGKMNAARVATDRSIPWMATHAEMIYPLTHGETLWIRFMLPPASSAERWYLEVPYPSVDRVTLYTPDEYGRWNGGASAGDTVPMTTWPVPHRYPLMPLGVSPTAPRHYLLRIENAHSFSAPLSFVSESHLGQHEQRTTLLLGIYFGLAGLTATVALLSAVMLRDAASALYGLSTALIGLSQAGFTGIASLHLWPTWPAWSAVASMVMPVLALGVLLWFFSTAVSLAQRSRRMHRLLLVQQLLALPVALAIVLIDPSHRSVLTVTYVVLATVSSGLALLWAARRGDPWGSWLLGAFALAGLGAAPALARTAGLTATSFWTQHGVQVGLAIQLPLVLAILMLRNQHRREHHRRIHGLDRIDPSTGLINANVFTERLVRLIARSQRLKLRSAVLLIDITNLAAIRRTFDQRAAQELPLRVAGRLLGVAREIDSVARLSEERFGMLLEGPLTAEDVAAAAPRVVAQCLMPYRNKPLDWVAQVRVAQALIPMDGEDAYELLARMDALLARVQPQERRAVFPLGQPAPWTPAA